MVANAMALPAGSTLAGQPWTLLNVLSATVDRRQQLELTRAYWRLTQAVGEYHFCADHAARLGQLKASSADAAATRFGQAAAAAMLRQAELEATEAQYGLAQLLRLPGGAALPLPADRPHVGAYRTNFHVLFAGRTAPESALLMDRILPIRRRAIDEQAAAVQAAEDVLAAVTDQQLSGRGDLIDFAACSQELLGQQRRFVRTVCQYNRNIADYAFVVTGPTTSPQGLVAILIGPLQQATPAGAVQTVGANERVADPMQQAVRDGWNKTEPTLAPPRDAPKKEEPTLAPPRDSLQAVGKNEPTLAPPRDSLPAGIKNEPTPAPPRDSLPAGVKNEPTPAPPRKDAAAGQPAKLDDKPAASNDRTSPTLALPQQRTANKPVVADSAVAGFCGRKDGVGRCHFAVVRCSARCRAGRADEGTDRRVALGPLVAAGDRPTHQPARLPDARLGNGSPGHDQRLLARPPTGCRIPGARPAGGTARGV